MPIEQQPDRSIPQPTLPVDRLTQVCTYHFEQHGEQPHSVVHRSSTFLSGPQLGQPWQRRQDLGPDRMPVDLGWLSGSKVAKLILENKTPVVEIGTPTQKQVAVAQEKNTIQLSWAPDGPVVALLAPGDILPITPAQGAELYAQAATAARLLVTAYPG